MHAAIFAMFPQQGWVILSRLTLAAALSCAALLCVPAFVAQRDRPAESLEALEGDARKDSLDADVRFRLAMRYWNLKRYDKAEREFRQVIAIDPRYAPAYLGLAFLPYDRRRKLWQEEAKGRVPPEWQPVLEESYRLRRQAFLIDPLVDLRPLGEPLPPAQPLVLPEYGQATTRFLLDLGVWAFGAMQYQLAYSAFNHYVQRAFPFQPRDSLPSYVYWYRGLSAAHLGNLDEAIEDLETLLERELKQERADTLIKIQLRTNDYRYVLAVLEERSGWFARAVNLYQDAIANDLGLYMAHVRLGQLYRRTGRPQDAVAEARRAVESNPDDPTTLLELGIIFDEANRLAEAEETLNRAMVANPRDARIPYQLGVLEHRLGNVEAARAAFTRFLAIASGKQAEQIADVKRRLAALQ